MTAPDPTALGEAWPLFELRIRSEHLLLRLPTDDDLIALLQLAKAGIHPPDEMPFGVAWSLLPSREFERGFLAQSRPPPPVTVESLDACRDWFGV
jgi:hypothetical protein